MLVGKLCGPVVAYFDSDPERLGACFREPAWLSWALSVWRLSVAKLNMLLEREVGVDRLMRELHQEEDKILSKQKYEMMR